MVRTILADDETIILRGLKQLIDWNKLGVDIICEVEDGLQVIDLIEEKKPQLLILDISMPGCTGLDVLKYIKEKQLDIKVIFISGYQEFSYARDAVKYGAVDYLLKPVERGELEVAIKKAVSIINMQGQLESITVTEKENKVYQIFQKINSNKNYAQEELYEQFSNLNLDISGKFLTGLALRIYFLKGSNHSGKIQELFKFSAYNRIQKCLEQNEWGFLIKKDINTCYAVLIWKQKPDKNDINERINSLIYTVGEAQKTIIITGIGKTINDITSLQIAYKTSRYSMDLFYFLEENRIWYDDINQLNIDYTRSFDLYQDKYQRLIDVLLNRKTSIDYEIKDILNVIRDLHFGNKFAVMNRCNLLVFNLTQELHSCHLLDESWICDLDNFMEELRGKLLYRQVCEKVTEYIKNIHKAIIKGENVEFHEIVRIQQYIQQNFKDDLTLEKMAKFANMNPYYFSSYFKKNIGENFKSYLTNIRMKEAVRLLYHTDYKAYEIAEAVGYKNVRQFNENFKAKFGKSPSEFRKQQEKDK